MVKQTLLVKLEPTIEQFERLKQTMTLFNEACNYIAEVAFEKKITSKVVIQPFVYYEVRKKFNLSAQMTIRAIAKTIEAYKRDKKFKPCFRLDGSMVYDQRIFSWRGLDKVSILTVNGREIIPVRIGEYQKVRLDRIRGQVDLILRKGTFYLCVVVDAPEATKYDAVGTLGVDLGVINIAVDSDKEIHTADGVENVRRKTARVRSALQSCGTKSAKRHLKKISGKEARFKRNVNHIISKQLVAKAKDTTRRIALEDLKGIRKKTVVRKAQRSRHTSWSFNQLRSFIEYKSEKMGVPIVYVDPRNTSRTCPSCNNISKKNRRTQAEFKCCVCGFAGHADIIAAINIKVRADVNQPIVAGDIEHFVQPQLQANDFSHW